MENLDEIKEYLDLNLGHHLSVVEKYDYEYVGDSNEVIPIFGKVARYKFESKKLDRVIEVRFAYTSTSPGGCIHAFIRRFPKENKGSFYNELKVRINVKNYYAHEFKKPDTLHSYLTDLNRIIESEYARVVDGSKFKPDNTNFRAM